MNAEAGGELDKRRDWLMFRGHAWCAVFKRWNRKVDERRFASVAEGEGKAITPTLDENEIEAPNDWVASVEEQLRSLVLPVHADLTPKRDDDDDIRYELNLWRGDAESEFSWHQPPPGNWRPLVEFYFDLLHRLQQHLAVQT